MRNHFILQICLNAFSWKIYFDSMRLTPMVVKMSTVNKSAFVQTLAWCLSSDKPLPEPMLIYYAIWRHQATLNWYLYYDAPIDLNIIICFSFEPKEFCHIIYENAYWLEWHCVYVSNNGMFRKYTDDTHLWWYSYGSGDEGGPALLRGFAIIW